MSITVQSVINWARTQTKLQPLVNIGALSSSEPGLTFANDVKLKIIARPYAWKWNRATHPSFLSVANQEDYILHVNDIGWIERATMTEDNVTSTPQPRWNLEVVHQMLPGYSQGTPIKVAVERDSNGVDVLRFFPIPDVAIYRMFIDYQKKCELMTALTDNFDPIPDDMGGVIRELFLAYAMRMLDDKRAFSVMQAAEQKLAELSGYKDAENARHEMIIPERPIMIG